MGSSASRITDENKLEEYTELTYLKKAEIQYIWKHFYSMDPDQVRRNSTCSLPVTRLEKFLPQLTTG
jgi:hypothetical protein